MVRPALSILCLFCLISCTRKQETLSFDEASSSLSVPLVEAGILEKEEFRNEYSSFGSITYVSKVDVYPMSSEIIRSLLVEEGDRVNRGDLLARLDKRKLEIQLRETLAGIETMEAKANLARQRWIESKRGIESRFYSISSAEWDLEKKQADFQRIAAVLDNKTQLFDAGGVTKEELESVRLEYFEKETELRKTEVNLAMSRIGYRDEDLLAAGLLVPEDPEERKEQLVEYNTRLQKAEWDVAESELNAARTRIETLELYLEETSIRSPIDGVVARKYMEEGEKASPEKPLYLIFPDNAVYARTEVSEKDLPGMKTGLETIVSSDTDDSVRTGKIDRISPWIESESRTGVVHVLLDNQDGLFTVGQFVRLVVRLSEPKSEILVPAEAVLKDEDAEYVFTLRNNRIFRREILCGREQSGRLPVLEGLEVGERIVLDPRSGFVQGMEVRIR